MSATAFPDPVAAITGAADTLSALTTTPWHELPGQAAHDALDELERAERHLAALRAQVLPVVEANGLWALQGTRTYAAWLRQRTGSTAGSASRQVREARALRDHLPLTREALSVGRISPEHVAVLVRETTRTQELRTQLTDEDLGEGFLVAQAEAMDAGTFTQLVRAWTVAADPEGADRAWREADSKEELTLSRTTDGFHLRGWLDEVSGQIVGTALQAHAGRKGAKDERTPAQRRAAALVSLASQSLDAGIQGAAARIRPHLTVTTSLETLRALAEAMGSAIPPLGPDGRPYAPGAAFGPSSKAALTATGGPRDPEAPEAAGEVALFTASEETRRWLEQWESGDEHVISTAIDYEQVVGLEPPTLEDGTPIPPAVLARLACESQLSRVIFGAVSTILDAGRDKRIFPANQVRAVIARDKHCQYPGCDEPPGFGEIHHSLWWAQHLGGTDVEHGILLCWHHHDWVHAQQITITRAEGQWWFRDRHGWLITADP
ncbi:DUF222 domain-containing protein [Georgenia phoenicis]|uniref:HNH endonuclease signature motif containing protein n=1 Tax=unclassified Georgenia TaxID=2626815 RepID=UPI0039AEA50C